jgi:hypothetical protein
MPEGGQIPPDKKRLAVLESNARILDRIAAMHRELADLYAALAANELDPDA